MTTLEQPTHARTLPWYERDIAHILRLIAGDGITCTDLIVFGAELRKALRAKQEAERETQCSHTTHTQV